MKTYCTDSPFHDHATDCYIPRKSAIAWASICGLPHEQTDEDTGLGIVLWSDPPEPKVCENCEEIRADFEWWLRNRETPVVA